MPGHNHYLDCMCGWCCKDGVISNDWPRWDNGPRWPNLNATVESYTVPNALCPVCGAPVFFYRSPYDGRVFFDALGPPWPKHPCTDTYKGPVQKYILSPNSVKKQFDWQTKGWEPVVITSIERIKDWARLELRPNPSHQREFIVRATPWHDALAPGLPSHIKRLDASGIGKISFLCHTPSREKIVLAPLVHRTFVACEVQVFRSAHKGNAASLLQIANAAYRDWGVKETSSGSVRYPKFVDFSIAKQWLEKAAASGSDVAKHALQVDPLFANIGNKAY